MTGDSLNTSTVLSGRSAVVLQESPLKSRCEHLSDEIGSLIEALTMTGVRTAAAKRLETRFSRAVSLYFRRLARKFPYSSLTSYVNQYRTVEAQATQATPYRKISDVSWLLETKKGDARKLTGKAVEAGSDDLEKIIEDGVTKGYELGGKQAAAAVRITPTFDLVDEGAKRWIRRRAARQVTNIDEVTRDRLARILIEGVDKGQSVPKIAGNIRSGIMEMSRYRSSLIAQNELNESMSESSLRTYKRLDVTHKSWSAALEPCDVCAPNEAQGIISIDATFQSGHARPPAHPGCLCTLTPERPR